MSLSNLPKQLLLSIFYRYRVSSLNILDRAHNIPTIEKVVLSQDDRNFVLKNPRNEI